MRNHKIYRSVGSMLMCMALTLYSVSTAFAARPAKANDNFVDAIAIGALPFSDVVNITDFSTEPGESFFCSFTPQTVWYSFTATANAVLAADTLNSDFSDTNLTVYRAAGPGLGGLNVLGCSSFGGSVTFSVQSGDTYYIQAGKISGGAGSLQVNLVEVPPPPNDNFANATSIDALPFTAPMDITGATTESAEPTPSCAISIGPVSRTAWLIFTPTMDGSISASVFNTPFAPVVAAYTGNALSSLAEEDSRCFGGKLTFRVNAGTTYNFQVAGLFGQGGPLQFVLEVTPPPVANFSFFPSDPSMFDTVQFFDNSSDPGEEGFELREWDFGDGGTTTGPECCPTHRYMADGDYMVSLMVTTFDGRTASTSQLVQVRTHDAAITKFSVPRSASAGQTREITVGIRNSRYPETIRVELFRSVPGGFQFVGLLDQAVPVRPSNRTTDFNFSYTFTSEDAKVGKVTFKAIATIPTARDALPADNEAISSPTKVSK